MSITAKVPEVGQIYHFFDDGKSSHSRHFMCRIDEIISYKDMKDMDLFDAWLREKEECYWLFAETTDYFIKGYCPKYYERELWFVRTKNGGWFSLDYPHWMIGGKLDVDECQLNSILKWDPEYLNEAGENEKWN